MSECVCVCVCVYEGHLSGSLRWLSMAVWNYLTFEFEFELWVYALG